MKRDLVIYGAGGLGRELLEIAELMNAEQAAWNILGFVDDAADRHGQAMIDYPILGGRDWLTAHQAEVVLAIGATAARFRLARELAARGVRFATLIHPQCVISRRSTLAAGSAVFAHVTIGSRTRVGEQVVVSRNAAVGHDIEIRDCVNIFPTACVSGHSVLGEGCEIGSNATVIPGKHVGAWSVVGAGAVVVRDLPDNVVAVGAPAQAIKQREPGWHLQ